MDPRFLPHNTHLENATQFTELDYQLRQLYRQPYVYVPELLDTFPQDNPGIYTLGGGRQVGKTTLLKQWMERLLSKGIDPSAIAFLTGELIDDHHTLLHILQTVLTVMPKNTLCYVLLDEVTYIKDWDKTIKFVADAGMLEDVILMLTGSDLVLMQEARMRFPGRRGKAAIVNFHLYPLSFREYIVLKHGHKNMPFTDQFLDLLSTEFNQYLLHGGYMTAINDVAKYNRIQEATLVTYSDWIRGDMIKKGRQEYYLREILGAVIKRYTTQITWNSLSKDLSIDHPKTVSDYIAILESMDAVFVQGALLEDKLTAAPKKAKKVIFTDTFIFHAIRYWISPIKDPYENQITPLLQDSKECSKLIEACVVAHYRRYYPTYYIKAEGEVDLAYIRENKFWPIEIKWTEQIRSADLKQIVKYPQGKILTKHKAAGEIQNVPTEFLPLALWHIE